jgi:hypothetical protein
LISYMCVRTSMTVPVVQAPGVVLAVFCVEVSDCHSTPSVFDIWAMPEDGPPIGLQLRRALFARQ